jgi:tRNA pseudouridine55 synthase
VDGLVIVCKPVGPTSAQVVGAVKRIVGTNKAGHCGTLDPTASGVLPVAVGEGTKLAGLIGGGDKEYVCRLRLGVATDTDDAEGSVISRGDASDVSSEAIIAGMKELTGRIEQVPPAYSSVKVKGRRAHELARRGESVPLRPRCVHVSSFDLLGRNGDTLDCRVCCGSGTYIRSLARDLGQRLGCGGHVVSLVRTAASGFSISVSVTPVGLRYLRDRGLLQEAVLSIERATVGWPRFLLNCSSVERVSHGQPIRTCDVREVIGSPTVGSTVVLVDDLRVLAVGEMLCELESAPSEKSVFRYRRVFRSDA